MRNQTYPLLLLICLLCFFSCSKENKQAQPVPKKTGPDLEKGIVNFSVNGQVVDAVIDTTFNTITITVPEDANQHNLTVSFTLASQFTATVNGKPVSSNSALDLSSPVDFVIASANNAATLKFRLITQNELQYFGVGGNILIHKSLNKNYSFYYDQWDGSTYASINCGPTSSTMAIKWADSTFSKKPVDARDNIPEGGGWWSTGDISTYLSENGIKSTVDTLGNLDSLVKRTIDNNNVLILCLDMFYVPYNENFDEHVQKFYHTNAQGWGHFILIKGYVQLTNDFYLEAYDPYSEGMTYSVATIGQPKGKDRYYRADDIKIATNIWWPYAIIAAPKGQSVVAAAPLLKTKLHKPVPIAMGR